MGDDEYFGSNTNDLIEAFTNQAEETERRKIELLEETKRRKTALILERIENAAKTGSLDLSGLQLSALPAEIWQLFNLTSLNLSNNQLAILSNEIGLFEKLAWLNVSDNRLKSLPTTIRNLTKLDLLHVSKNKIAFLPTEVGRLVNLTSLNLSDNQITSLPAEIGKLAKLISLDLSGNKLETLPVEFQDIQYLTELNLDGNSLPIPPEIIGKTKNPQAILDYYFSNLKRALNECKILVVGQGSVGKTSLIRRLLENRYDSKENKTEGIDIHHSNFHVKGTTYSVNIWDFGGQEIMHATHQFFLTKRSLYLLILDSRLTQEENRVEYWLKIIQSFGGESPVLVVGNKTDQHSLDIDRSGLQKKYPNIVRIFETSAATGQGMGTLRSAMAKQIDSLPHIHDLLPMSCDLALF